MKLESRRSSEGGENAIDRGEQKKLRSKGKRGYRDSEREIEQVCNYVLPSISPSSLSPPPLSLPSLPLSLPQICNPLRAGILHSLVKSSELQILERCGHAITQERSRKCASLLSDFISSNNDGGSSSDSVSISTYTS